MPALNEIPEVKDRKDSGRLLLVEDEISLARPVKRGLEEAGYHVDFVEDGVAGEERALAGSYDVLLVDWRLPGRDGRTLVERLRNQGYQRPVIMLTVRRDIADRVSGLDAGADDYLTKPFSFDELLARVRALIRRSRSEASDIGISDSSVLRLGDLEMDPATRRVSFGPSSLDLRVKEFALLEFLLRHPGRVLSRTEIAETIWGSAWEVSDNAINVTVSSLRQKLSSTDTLQPGVTLDTVRGIGYALRVRPGTDQSAVSRS